MLNVKEGHCERYASGLALTLRGLGIPCRVVHGFRGWEQAEDELLIVRFNHVHSWVQALVPRADGEGNDWILLDATPSFEAPIDRWQAFVEWFGKTYVRPGRAFATACSNMGPINSRLGSCAWWPRTALAPGKRRRILAIGRYRHRGSRRIALFANANRLVVEGAPHGPIAAPIIAMVDGSLGRSLWPKPAYRRRRARRCSSSQALFALARALPWEMRSQAWRTPSIGLASAVNRCPLTKRVTLSEAWSVCLGRRAGKSLSEKGSDPLEFQGV